MKNQIFLDEIDDEAGAHALNLALSSLQAALPEGNYICGCVHRLGRMHRAHFRIFVDGAAHDIDWSGWKILDLVQFIEGNLVPILGTWRRSLSEFFQNLSLKSGEALPCKRGQCAVGQRMQKKSNFAKKRELVSS